MAPAYAVSDMLKQANLNLQDFDFYEIHEAFAAQVIATLKAWQSEEFCRNRLGRNVPMGPIDLSRLNVKGGSIAIGHPFAATGARIMASLAKLLNNRPVPTIAYSTYSCHRTALTKTRKVLNSPM